MGEKAAATAHSASCLFPRNAQTLRSRRSMWRFIWQHAESQANPSKGNRQIMNFDFFFNLDFHISHHWTATISCSAPTWGVLAPSLCILQEISAGSIMPPSFSSTLPHYNLVNYQTYASASSSPATGFGSNTYFTLQLKQVGVGICLLLRLIFPLEQIQRSLDF